MIARSLDRLIAPVLRFLLPWACAGCRGALTDLEDHGFCGRCWMSIPRIQGLICRACGISLKDGGDSCYACRRAPPPLLIRAAAEYRGVIPPAIYRFKYAGRQSLRRPLGMLLRHAWDQYPELHRVQGLVPVPLHPGNERARGFNQAELLAAELGGAIALPVLPLLARTRKTRSHYALNRAERFANVRSAFALDPRIASKSAVLRGCSFLLIDDICTTASTLGECAAVLDGLGARAVMALVLSRDL